jgi:hypothetical protein
LHERALQRKVYRLKTSRDQLESVLRKTAEESIPDEFFSDEHGCRPHQSLETRADSALKPAAIPIINRPPFRFEAGHHSNQ